MQSVPAVCPHFFMFPIASVMSYIQVLVGRSVGRRYRASIPAGPRKLEGCNGTDMGWNETDKEEDDTYEFTALCASHPWLFNALTAELRSSWVKFMNCWIAAFCCAL